MIIHLLGSKGTLYQEEKTSDTKKRMLHLQLECRVKRGSSWLCKMRKDFRFIVISPHLISDHKAEVIISEFASLASRCGIKIPLSEVLDK
mmetsp:Transcript_30150/g.56562  ORF Transcript_30150/g.56562 Transcript_30150/m.56562 type:complete len:90 (-) Transcript_30150:57-326(-)